METLPVDRLRFFPVTWFATVMGMTGFALVWRNAQAFVPVPLLVPRTLAGFAAALFVLLLGLYVAKAIKYPGEVIKEWRHPVRVNFAPTLSIGLILLATAFAPDAPSVSFWLWAVGSALNLIVTLYVVSFWINHPGFQIQHMNPAWFIPAVSNILVPLVGVRYATPEISWFFFSIGLVFWLVLFTIVMYRVIFHDPLPERLVPTLFIIIAPPAVGFVAYVALTNNIDNFARVLYYTALFLTLLLFTQVRRFARLQFFLSWWAYSFPVAAITIATMMMYRRIGHPVLQWTGWLLLVVLTALIVLLVTRTSLAVKRGQICVEEK